MPKGRFAILAKCTSAGAIFFPTDFCRLAGHTGGAGCSPVGEKCPFGHKKGGRCSPEAVALHLGHTGGAGCSPVVEKCPFGHKKGCVCSPELAELQAGYILGCIGVFS